MADITNLEVLEAKLKASVGVTSPQQQAADRDVVKAGSLLSIAKSLEANKVPEHWESLEGPSGAILGWFDPQVARAIAQALGATEQRQTDADAEDDADEPEPLPVIVGATVVLTEALALADGDPDVIASLTLGTVLDMGHTEGELYAYVEWQGDDAPGPYKMWASALTVLATVEGEPTEPELRGDLEGAVPTADLIGEEPPARDDDEPEDDIEVEGDDIDADFDTVVESEPAAPVDGLSALKGKSKGKR